MRIHSLENVDKALQFLKEQRVHLENVGSHDIVDGNHRLTLGFIWTIILRSRVWGSPPLSPLPKPPPPPPHIGWAPPNPAAPRPPPRSR